MEKKVYTNFEALDFAQEPSFIRYVKDSDEQAVEFWEKWLADHPEKAAEIKSARKLVGAIQVKESAVDARQTDQLWKKIHTEINQEASIHSLPVRRSAIRRWLGVAAAACAGLLLFFYLYNPNTSIHVGAAEQLVYFLPDSSRVTVNAGSELAFNVKKWKENREVILNGEAFFEVKKGSRFHVKTDYGQVEVLGTSFNVYARKDAFAVDCFTGKVKVSTHKGQAQVLTPGLGTAITSSKELVQPAAFSLAETATWRQGEFYYEKVKLGTVFDELERQFDVDIQAEESIREKIGKIYFDNSNLDSALYKVTWPMGLKVTKNGRQIVIE